MNPEERLFTRGQERPTDTKVSIIKATMVRDSHDPFGQFSDSAKVHGSDNLPSTTTQDQKISVLIEGHTSVSKKMPQTTKDLAKVKILEDLKEIMSSRRVKFSQLVFEWQFDAERLNLVLAVIRGKKRRILRFGESETEAWPIAPEIARKHTCKIVNIVYCLLRAQQTDRIGGLRAPAGLVMNIPPTAVRPVTFLNEVNERRADSCFNRLVSFGAL